MRFNSSFKTSIWIITAVFFLMGTAHSFTISRVMPSGKINVYRDGRLVQVLKEQAPVPTDAMLGIQGDSGIRLDNLYLVAKDGSMLGVAADSSAARLKIDKGLVFFAANSSTGPMVFETPSGVIDTRRITIEASGNQAMLKGYVDVSAESTKIGVLEGGTMVVTTPEGEKSIGTGKQIVVAQAELIKPEEESSAEAAADDPNEPAAETETSATDVSDGKIPGYYYAAGAGILGLLGLGIALGSSSSDDSDPPPASPAAP